MNTAKLITLGLLRGSGAAAAFSPLDIAGLVLWLDASDSTTLFQASNGTTPAVADTNPVGYWADKSGSGNHATQSTDDKRPLLKLAIQNGKNVIRYDGTNDSLAFAGSSLDMLRNKPYGYVFSAYDANHTGATQRTVFGGQNNGAGSRLFLFDGATANRYSVAARRLDGDSPLSITSDTDHNAEQVVISVLAQWNDGTLTLRQNGASVASGNFATSGNTSNTASGAICIGSLNTTNYSIGDFCEVLVYTPSSALSSDSVAAIETYLGTKWGITVSPSP